MRDTSIVTRSLSANTTREVYVRARFNDTTTLTGDNIISMILKEGVCPSSGITMGQTISASVTIRMRMPDPAIPLDGGYVDPYAGFLRGITPYGCNLGRYYITDIKKTSAQCVEITGYDGFCRTENTYVPSVSMPNTAENIINDIAAQCGFEVAITDFPEGNFEYYEFTCRKWLGYFAGLVGCNAVFDSAGKLNFRWFSPETKSLLPISRTQQYMNGAEQQTFSPLVVDSITSGTKDNILVSGTGKGINFENPFMSQTILDSIFANRIVSDGYCPYTPCKIKWRGNPQIEAGDSVRVELPNGDRVRVLVMEQTLTISGGMYSEIVCYGQSDAKLAFQTAPTSKKIEQVYTNLQKAIADATALLNGANGGVFEVIDENADGVNDGWIIHSPDGRKFIRANLNGIGITEDGGATYKQAITVDGINATAITVGNLNAERIAVENYDSSDPTKITDYIRFGDGTITLGKGDSVIILKLENDQIGFYNDQNVRLCRLTNNSFEIENLEDGQIRFQNFGFIPRESGNLTFTKLL